MKRLLAVLVGLLVATEARGQAPAASRRAPNVIVIITDDQGYGDLGCHGNEKVRTPNIDRLAAQSVRFTQFCVAPVCTPTRASLMTGRYHHRTGAIDTYQGRALMQADEETLAEVLRAAGYRTGLFGKWHLGDNYPRRPQDQGFEEVLMHRGGGMVQPGDPPGSRYMDPILQHNGVQKTYEGYCTDVFAEAAMRFMEENRERPFFAYVATNAPHTPLEVPEDWVKPYREMGLDETTAKIYAMVENIDANVGRILKKLDELKLAEETIVLYMHDNGPQQKRFNANLRGLKGSVYEGGIRSPLFVRWAGKTTPREIDKLVAHIDLFPTLLELCGVKHETKRAIDGISLAPMVLGAKVEWIDRTLFFQWHRGDEPKAYDNAAVRQARFKLVNGKELYELQTDPGEEKDVAAEHPQVVKELREKYERWFDDVTKERPFAPEACPIVLGSERENPATLTRQDWRGPRANWNPVGLGHWHVDVAREGVYRITLRFGPAAADTTARFQLGAVKLSTQLQKDQERCTFDAVRLKPGPSRVDAAVGTSLYEVGVHYIDVERVGD